MSFCEICGKKLEPGDRFCPNCGHPVSEGKSASDSGVKGVYTKNNDTGEKELKDFASRERSG